MQDLTADKWCKGDCQIKEANTGEERSEASDTGDENMTVCVEGFLGCVLGAGHKEGEGQTQGCRWQDWRY